MPKQHNISRRTLLAAGGMLFGILPVKGQLVDKDPYALKPGEFTWHPERAGEGPVAIIVSIPEQRVFVYRRGIRVASSTCSTGKPGHSTPTGVFTILQKDKHHRSSTYNNAPMPNMNRLTWSGVALHAGELPGYPASHGCVRLPLEFSARLFSITHVGTPVIIASAASQPAEVVHPGLHLSNYAEEEFDEAASHLKKKSLPAMTHEENEQLPLAVVISAADRMGYLFENGTEIASGPVTIADPSLPLGSHVFVLAGAHDAAKGMQWHAIGYHPTEKGAVATPDVDIIKRVRAAPSFVAAMKTRMHPGLTLVLTDRPASSVTRTGKGFVIFNDS